MLLFALPVLSHTTLCLANAEDVTIPPWVPTECHPTTNPCMNLLYFTRLQRIPGSPTFRSVFNTLEDGRYYGRKMSNLLEDLNLNFSKVRETVSHPHSIRPVSKEALYEHSLQMQLTEASTSSLFTTKKAENFDVRLPRSLKPLHYLVKLQPFINGNFSIIGYMEVEMEVLEPNMPIADTVPVLVGQEGWVWDRYEKSVPMSTYLVAFIVSDYVQINSTANDHVAFRVWVRQETIDQAEYANEVSPKILGFFEDYFNLSYPLPKMDMIALTDFSAGAMENWGLITYRESFLLYDAQVTTPVDKSIIAEIISHELAHQWFGNLVTPKWCDDLWLNEGFATYISYLGNLYRISIPVSDPDDIYEVFDDISYSKGSSIIRMMTHYLTEPTFRKGLSNYLKALTYNSSVQDDLWKHLTVAAHEDGILPKDVTVKMIMDTWTLQMGYPVVKVTRSADGTSAILTQERFLLERSANSSNTTGYKWWVPLTYTTQNEANFNQTQAKLWMKDSEDHVTVSSLPPKDQWVIFNLQETGYYRVNYDDHNWNLIIQQLKKDHQVFCPVNRGEIIDDAMNLARADHLSYKIAIGAYTFLWKEDEYLPWATGVNKLYYIESMFKRRSGFGALKCLSNVLSFYNDLGSSIIRMMTHYLTEATFRKGLSNYLKSAVYCHAIAEGGEAEWDFAWDQYITTSDPETSTIAELKPIFPNFSWFHDFVALLPDFATRSSFGYLEMAMNPGNGIRLQDAIYVLKNMSNNDVGRSLIWDYLTLHWNNIYTLTQTLPSSPWIYDYIIITIVIKTTMVYRWQGKPRWRRRPHNRSISGKIPDRATLIGGQHPDIQNIDFPRSMWIASSPRPNQRRNSTVTRSARIWSSMNRPRTGPWQQIGPHLAQGSFGPEGCRIERDLQHPP
ncbi:LOW QUALITY PROTEIN: aminopeptidase Ey-like [Penaeus chinensis]|uniref:LOW QUALITY PROTEIN: aminopeptidase Ey-like n=1 Tax=Penaeus chinensis TaxID=139456 RepID=UPI001FB72561|nr:LOW QUALITY PROTEIN: aminopeptidase Ey-like [Penaeus chinensis]